MRFGNWRGVTPALGCASALLLTFCLSSTPVGAQDFHTIPRLVPAINENTGQPYYAPPIPYGHYAGKDISGKVSGKIHGLLGNFHGKGHGSGSGNGDGSGDPGCDTCGSKGGHGGLFHHSNGGLCDGSDGCGGGGHFGKHKGLGGCGLCGGKGCGSCIGHASNVVEASAQGAPSPQGPVVASPQCGDPGCGLVSKHHHKGCGLCGGKGCGGCAVADPCGNCGGAGCGLCSKAKGMVHSALDTLLHRNDIKWFNGAGGPVPLTPGYVPYINVTRSPRDFFAFPPMTP